MIVWVQNPVRLDDYSEPLPDVALLKRRDDFYAASHPSPADVLLVIEVADTSVEYDREVKVPLYGQAGIPEVRLVNLREEAIETYAQPDGGVYQTIRQVRRGDTITPHNISHLTLSVDAVLG